MPCTDFGLVHFSAVTINRINWRAVKTTFLSSPKIIFLIYFACWLYPIPGHFLFFLSFSSLLWRGFVQDFTIFKKQNISFYSWSSQNIWIGIDKLICVFYISFIHNFSLSPEKGLNGKIPRLGKVENQS